MSFLDDLPAKESLGVFLGVSGLEWLSLGHANPLSALFVALVFGLVLAALRLTMKKHRKR